jgi:hypothetical protein
MTTKEKLLNILAIDISSSIVRLLRIALMILLITGPLIWVMLLSLCNGYVYLAGYAGLVATAIPVFGKRIWHCFLAGFLSFNFGCITHGLMEPIQLILVVFFLGAIAAPFESYVRSSYLWLFVISRFFRSIFSIAILFIILRCPIPTSGACQAGIGSITQSYLFLIILAYTLLAGLSIYDFVYTKLTSKYHLGKNRDNNRLDDTSLERK